MKSDRENMKIVLQAFLKNVGYGEFSFVSFASELDPRLSDSRNLVDEDLRRVWDYVDSYEHHLSHWDPDMNGKDWTIARADLEYLVQQITADAEIDWDRVRGVSWKVVRQSRPKKESEFSKNPLRSWLRLGFGVVGMIVVPSVVEYGIATANPNMLDASIWPALIAGVAFVWTLPFGLGGEVQ